MAGIVFLYAETASSTGSVWHVRSFKSCCEILLLLNIADMDSYLCGKLRSAVLSAVFI